MISLRDGNPRQKCQKNDPIFVIMKLSEVDLEIVGASFLRADAPASELAHATGHSSSRVRRARERLCEDQLLQSYHFIDVYQLGFQHFGLFFRLSPGERGATRAEVRAALVASPHVSWVVEVGGEFDFGVSVFARSAAEAAAFIENSPVLSSSSISNRLVAVRNRLVHFTPKFLSRCGASQRPLEWGGVVSQHSVDDLDHAILAELSLHGNRTEELLAAALQIQRTTLRYRLSGLRQREILRGRVHILDYARLGIGSFYMLLSIRAMNEHRTAQFVEFCRQHPNILFLVECLGSWNAELGVNVHSNAEVVGLTEELKSFLGGALQEIRCLTVFSYPKVANYPGLLREASGSTQARLRGKTDASKGSSILRVS